MAMTMSRFICMSCATPPSTEKVWVVVPESQRESSVEVSQRQVRETRIVKMPPEEEESLR